VKPFEPEHQVIVSTVRTRLWSRAEFGGQDRQRQICTAIVPSPPAATGCVEGGLLVLAAASVQAVARATRRQVPEVLAQHSSPRGSTWSKSPSRAVGPDLLHLGIAVTASHAVIDQIAADGLTGQVECSLVCSRGGPVVQEGFCQHPLQ
jgi:hypothetical protein